MKIVKHNLGWYAFHNRWYLHPNGKWYRFCYEYFESEESANSAVDQQIDQAIKMNQGERDVHAVCKRERRLVEPPWLRLLKAPFRWLVGK